MAELCELLNYTNIVIQTHDIPDADAIGSGFALQCYLRSFGVKVRLVYGESAEIQKPSLLIMLEALKIEIDYIEELPGDIDLLITVDCQRGAGNVQDFELPTAADVIVIDHHKPEIPESSNTIIRSTLASCATLVWDLLRKEGFNMDSRVKTALYYGLFTDTNGMSELRHPLDRDLAEVDCDAGLIRKLKNSAITADELDIIGGALHTKEIINGVGLFRAEPCDPNLLGFASDIAQQVVQIDCCIVYCLQSLGIKLSIRSCVREIMASEFAEFLCNDTGSGGGAIDKAGGYMGYKGIAAVSGEIEPEEYLKKRVNEYLRHYDHIYAGKCDIDFGAMMQYKKLPVPVGFARSTDFFPSGTKITIRMLEGDVDTATDDDVYLMIGILGEVYPIRKERFETDYHILEETYARQHEYAPTIINRTTGHRLEIVPFAKLCVPVDNKLVRGKKLDKHTKVFAEWDTEKYFFGKPGDWLVANEGAYDDCYIVRGDVFAMSYEGVG